MVEISLRLIRNQYPDLNADNLHELKVLDLSNLNITSIDSLEIVSHATELYLQCNKIEIIENIDFMDDLKILDLSFNNITSENLILSLKYIPKYLHSLNLSGNPCANDESALLQLQDFMPSLGIIIGLESGDIFTNDENEEVVSENDTPDSNSNTSSIPYRPLDADVVLKEIVERKCRPNEFSPDKFNLQSTIEVLNSELQDSLSSISKDTKKWAHNKIAEQKEDSDSKDEVGSNSQTKINELMTLNQINRDNYSSSDFVTRLRTVSLNSRNKLFHADGTNV